MSDLRKTSSLRNRGSEVRILPSAQDAGELEQLAGAPHPAGSDTTKHVARIELKLRGAVEVLEQLEHRDRHLAALGLEVEQRLRSIVVGGLWPILEVLVRGELDVLACRVDEGQAMVALGLATPVPEPEPAYMVPEHALARRRPVPLDVKLTELAHEVHQQLAVLRSAEARLPALGRTVTGVAGWHHVLLDAGQPNDRGARLLAWLRLGSVECRCQTCDEPATGLGVRRFGPRRVLGLACDRHRTRPSWWHEGGGTLHRQTVLAEVPRG